MLLTVFFIVMCVITIILALISLVPIFVMGLFDMATALFLGLTGYLTVGLLVALIYKKYIRKAPEEEIRKYARYLGWSMVLLVVAKVVQLVVVPLVGTFCCWLSDKIQALIPS